MGVRSNVPNSCDTVVYFRAKCTNLKTGVLEREVFPSPPTPLPRTIYGVSLVRLDSVIDPNLLGEGSQYGEARF